MAISLSQNAKTLARTNFFGKDFSTYRQEIIDAMNTVFGTEITSNFVISDFGVMMIEMVAYALSTQAWYGDRQAAECTLDFEDGARIRANAVALARQLGYKPNGAIPPVADLSVTLSAPSSPARVTIERGAKVVETSGLAYETIEETVYDAGVLGPKTIQVRQGQSQEETFFSDGTASQRFFLQSVTEGHSIAQGTVEVRVNGALWTEVNLMTFTQTNIFEVELGREAPFVRFGNGVAGNIPTSDSEVRISFFTTLGIDGAVASNQITGFSDPVVAGTETVTASVTQTSPSTTGSARETLNSIKVNAPLVFQTGQRAVTINDLDGYINSFVDPTYGAVAKGRATSPRTAAADGALQGILTTLTNAGISADVTTDLSTHWNKVVSSYCKANVLVAQILSKDSDGRYVAASVNLAKALETFLDTKVESTAKVWVVDGSPNVLSVNITVQVKVIATEDTEVKRASIIEEVKNEVQTILLDRAYGLSLFISDVYTKIDAISGVDYANVSITNHSTRVDTYGNLSVNEYEVITLGTTPVVTVL